MRRFSILFVLAVLFPAAALRAQALMDTLTSRYATFAECCAPEKLYVHLDRTYYTAGESIWFRGWLASASRVDRFTLSNFLYAELLDAKGQAVTRAKIKQGRYGFAGCLELSAGLETGFYTFRAYTLWQMNSPSEYMFHERIRVVGSKKQKIRVPRTSADDVELSFWPEGGRYFAGVRSVIAFKVVDKAGRSADFHGTLMDGDGRIVTQLATRHDGMGAFEFEPVAGKTYQIVSPDGKKFPLPPVSTDGASIRFRRLSAGWFISVSGFGEGKASLLLRNPERLEPLANFPLNGLTYTVKANPDYFRPGINHLLAVDERGRILSERLFFVYDPSSPLCQVTPEQFRPDIRALTRASISLKDPDGRPLDGDCSVSVVRGLLKDWHQADGITSYFGLSSELKGSVNDPYWYFDPSVPAYERVAAMDLLMMIQGWRYYDLTKILDPNGGKFHIRYIRELTQSVTGRIRRRLSGKMPKKFTFALLVPKLKIYNSLHVDQADSYVVDSLDFEENTGFFIKIGASRVGVNYLPSWNGDPVAPPFVYKTAPGSMKTAMRESTPLQLGGLSTDTLKTAVIVADAGDADDLLAYGDAVSGEDLQRYKDFTLIEYISMRKASFVYDGDHMINRSLRAGHFSPAAVDLEDSESVAEDDGMEPRGAVKLRVNGSEEPWWGYDMIKMEDVKSISISSSADPIYGGAGGIVAITLKEGVTSRDLNRDPTLLYFVPLGHQVTRYFSSPRYDRGETMFQDTRNTVFWSYSVPIRGGRGSFEFCNTDLQDYPYTVRVEGMTASGQPFSCHCTLGER